MRAQAGDEVRASIHQLRANIHELRVRAEAEIPKPVIKTNEVSFGGDLPSGYVGTKIAAFLRDGLFG